MRRGRTRASRSTSPGTARSRRTRSRVTRPVPAGASSSTPPASRRWARGRAGSRSTTRSGRCRPSSGSGSRDRSWGIRPVGEQPAPGAAGRDARRPQLLVALHADALRRLLPVRDRAGRRRRQPRHQRGGAGVAGRPRRAARLARGRDHVSLGDAASRARGDAPPRREPQAVRHRVRDARLRRPRPRLGLRRRRLEPRALDGGRVGRPGQLRPQRPRDPEDDSASACSTTSGRRRATAPRATGCSSTPTWAVTTRAASPTSARSRHEATAAHVSVRRSEPWPEQAPRAEK